MVQWIEALFFSHHKEQEKEGLKNRCYIGELLLSGALPLSGILLMRSKIYRYFWAAIHFFQNFTWITITFNSFWDINQASRRAIVQRKTKIWKEQNYEYLYNTAAINKKK